jgi:hypothetical protein
MFLHFKIILLSKIGDTQLRSTPYQNYEIGKFVFRNMLHSIFSHMWKTDPKDKHIPQKQT